MPTRNRTYLIAALALLAGLWLLGDVLTPFLLGMVIAYVLDPLCDRLERRGWSRTRATATITAGFFALVALALAVMLPLLWSQAVTLIAQAPAFVDHAERFVQPLWTELAPHLTAPVVSRIETAAEGLTGTAASWIGSALSATLSGSLALVDVISTALITPLVAFYLIRDWDRLVGAIDHRIPRQLVTTCRARAQEIDLTLAAWMRGVATVCVILGTYYAVALSAIGLSYGLLIGLAAGLVSFVPFVGFFVGGALAMIAAVFTFDHWTMWLATAGIFALGQIAEGNFLTPRLVGRAVNLHEVWTIFALMAGGSLFGFTGVLLAIPVTAVLAVLIRHADRRYLNSSLYNPNAPKAPDGTADREAA